MSGFDRGIPGGMPVETKFHPALADLIVAHLGGPPGDVVPMEGGGSRRTYLRVTSVSGDSLVAVACEAPAEARSFLGFTRHFAGKGVPVPAILAENAVEGVYLLEDLGNVTMALQLRRWRRQPDGQARMEEAMRGVLDWLAKIQVRGAEGLDEGLFTESRELDGRVFRADLERFLRHVPDVSEAGGMLSGPAQAELDALIARLDAMPRPVFAYRDFQTRNIMWANRDGAGRVVHAGRRGEVPPDTTGGPVFLDYQSGRHGAPAYDLASLLYSPDSGLDSAQRAGMTAYYARALTREGLTTEAGALLEDLRPMVLIRRLQALGAYAALAVGADDPGKGQGFMNRMAPAARDLLALRQSGWLELGLPNLQAWIDWQLAGIAAI